LDIHEELFLLTVRVREEDRHLLDLSLSEWVGSRTSPVVDVFRSLSFSGQR
jgi:hypothetical protein